MALELQEGQVPLVNWKTGVVVGWWEYVGKVEVEMDGLSSDWIPMKEVVVDGVASVEIIRSHKHPDGYWFL